MHREDYNFCIWSCLSNLARGLKPVQIGHADINDGYVWFQLACFFYCLPAVHCLADDFPAPSRTEKSPNAAADQLVVVRHEDTKFLRGSSHVWVSSRLPWCRCCWIQYQGGRR